MPFYDRFCKIQAWISQARNYSKVLKLEKKLNIRGDYKSKACKSEKPFLVMAEVIYASSSGDSDH